MKIRKFYTVDNGVYKAALRTEDWSQADLQLIRKFGEPEIDLGGSFSGSPNFSLSSNLAGILTGIPFTQSFDTRDYPLQVTQITTLSAANLDGTYFLLNDADGKVAFWIDLDNSGTTEPVHNANRSVEVVTILATDSQLDVAAKLQAVIDADSKFSAVVSNGVVTVTNTDIGNFDPALSGTTNFAFVMQPNSTDANHRTNIWASEIEQRISDAVVELRTNKDDFTREEVKTV